MEAVPAETSEETSVGNQRTVKSGNSSPRSNGGRSSPPNCAICLGACENSSFTDSCLHQFCFNCLLTWSKVKAECPLCKQNFRSIIHNVRSINQYEEYLVEQRQTDAVQMINIDNISHAPPRFRYRTTLTLPRRDTMAIQQLLHYSLVTDFLQPSEAAVPRISPLSPASRYRPPAFFRRTVYRHNLWARPLPDFTGRFRDCSPQFYRYNDAQMHRLVPWINRELNYLLNENPSHISYVLSKILELLPNFHINSAEFMNALRRYLGERTEHFLHELYCFASTPYDMAGYDRNVQYTTDPRVSTVVNEVITSETDSSDSDIVLVSTSELADPPAAGPSRLAGPSASNRPTDLRSGVVHDPQIQTDNNVIPIETISQSDSDDNNSEVMVIGYIKPPQERTPEVVDLLGSDSDVVVQDTVDDNVYEPPIVPGPLVPVAPLHPLVKVSLKQHRGSTAPPDTDTDTDEELFVPRARRRPRSVGSATTVNTFRTTPTGSPTVSTDPNWSPSFNYHLPPSTSSFFNNTYSSLSEDSEPAPRKRTVQYKSKKKSKSRHRSDAVKAKTNSDKKQSSKRKLKSRSWKEIKSSKKRRNVKDSSDVAANTSDPPNTDQPSTSGLSRRTSRRTESRHKSKREKNEQCRVSGESKRLKSVVSIPQNRDSSLVPSTVVQTNSSLTYYSGDSSSTIEQPLAIIDSTYEQPMPHDTPDTYDSEDDLPLNLTVNKH